MVLELHIWGPGFGLPSIDAQCLATTAYFLYCLPFSEWRLIASSDTAIGRTKRLPALKDGLRWICGFHSILDYLRQKSGGRWDLDRGLSRKQRADIVAFSSFLESVGQPLIDLSLYVSSENYTKWTRPALGAILQWPEQWVTPHRLRDEAKMRSEHLGLSSLDMETVPEVAGRTQEGATRIIPSSLLTKPKETITDVLGDSGEINQFRLDAVTSDFFEPLCELVEKNGAHSWLFATDQPSSLDCLLLGYTSLMCPPSRPPRQWLQDALSVKYPALMQWAQNFRQESFSGPMDASAALSTSTSSSGGCETRLPWHARTTPSNKQAALTVLNTILSGLPFGLLDSRKIVRGTSDDAGTGRATSIFQTFPLPFLSMWGVVGSALSLMLGYSLLRGSNGEAGAAQRSAHVFRATTPSQQRFGEAGRMLGLI